MSSKEYRNKYRSTYFEVHKIKTCGGGENISRICLGGCDKEFLSIGKGNRICPKCRILEGRR